MDVSTFPDSVAMLVDKISWKAKNKAGNYIDWLEFTNNSGTTSAQFAPIYAKYAKYVEDLAADDGQGRIKTIHDIELIAEYGDWSASKRLDIIIESYGVNVLPSELEEVIVLAYNGNNRDPVTSFVFYASTKVELGADIGQLTSLPGNCGKRGLYEIPNRRNRKQIRMEDVEYELDCEENTDLNSQPYKCTLSVKIAPTCKGVTDPLNCSLKEVSDCESSTIKTQCPAFCDSCPDGSKRIYELPSNYSEDWGGYFYADIGKDRAAYPLKVNFSDQTPIKYVSGETSGNDNENDDETSGNNNESGGLQIGAIVGIVVGLLLLFLIIAAIFFGYQKSMANKDALFDGRGQAIYGQHGLYDTEVGFRPGHENPLYGWYQPNVSRKECTDTLQKKKEGAFIIRDSEANPGWHMIGVKTADNVVHDKIRLLGNGTYQLLPSSGMASESSQPHFKDIPSLVKHYERQNLQGMPYTLVEEEAIMMEDMYHNDLLKEGAVKAKHDNPNLKLHGVVLPEKNREYASHVQFSESNSDEGDGVLNPMYGVPTQSNTGNTTYNSAYTDIPPNSKDSYLDISPQ